MGMADERSSIEQLVGLLFAPAAIALALFDNLPTVKPIGPREVEQQIRSARMIGTMTMTQVRREVQRRIDSVTPSPTGPSSAPIETVAVAPLPIANYDSLTAAEILPLLGSLTPAEREATATHENKHRKRRTVLGRLDQLRA